MSIDKMDFTNEQMEAVKRSREEYRVFMDNYNLQRKACPKCGSEKYSTTLVGYIMFSDKREEYKDKNNCVCMECGDKHIFHDRVPSTRTFKDELLDEWMKENPPFDNDKESFEDYLVREIKVQDANHAIQLLEKDKQIESLHLHLKIEILANEKLRREHKNLSIQIENNNSFYDEETILNVLNKYYTDSAPNQHIKQNIIKDLKYEQGRDSKGN